MFLKTFKSIYYKLEVANCDLQSQGANENKQELISELSRSNGLSTAESKKVVERFFGKMADAMTQGQRVEIRGLFAFLFIVIGNRMRMGSYQANQPILQ